LRWMSATPPASLLTETTLAEVVACSIDPSFVYPEV
jgi:hypothetical protein